MSDADEKPTPLQVTQLVLADRDADDDCHWVLLNNGTFYTFNKREYADKSGDELVAEALDMADRAILVDYDDNDCVTVMPYKDEWPDHPVYVVLSCLRMRIGWVIIGATDKWAETEQELAAVGYLARTKYEMDCTKKKVIGTSFPWSGRE